MKQTIKSIFKSKTFYLGLIQIAIAVLTYIQGNLETGIALSVSGILTIVFRSITKTAVRL